MSRVESCPQCSSTSLAQHDEQRQIRAPDGTELPYAAQYSLCLTCGFEYYTARQTRLASRAAAGALRKHAGLLPPADMIALRAKYDLTQEDLEKIFRFGKKSVTRWEAGSVCQSRSADSLLREAIENPGFMRRSAEAAGVKIAQDRESWITIDYPISGVGYEISAGPPTHSVTAPRRTERSSGAYQSVMFEPLEATLQHQPGLVKTKLVRLAPNFFC